MKVHWFWCVLAGFDVVLCYFFADFGQNSHALFMHLLCIVYALFMRVLKAHKKRIKSA